MTLIERLADGRWHSGQQLAVDLGISRAAVWKQIQRLQEVGVEVYAVRGRGYRLAFPFEPLQVERISRALSTQTSALLQGLEVLTTVDSTNSRLLAATTDGVRVCFAEHQVGGRGRRGRQWCSPFGANLYFSIAWPLVHTPPALGAAGPAVGVHLAEWLRALGASVRLKWPNDLLLADAKMGGILIEHRGEGGGGCRLVVGVGLNIAMRQAQADAIDNPWATLEQDLGAKLPPRNELAAGAVDAVARALAEFERVGFAPMRRRWDQLDALRHARVRVEAEREILEGTATGIAADGALLLDSVEGQRRFYAGDVSLRAD